jgi:hypothetical protein
VPEQGAAQEVAPDPATEPTSEEIGCIHFLIKEQGADLLIRISVEDE